MELNEDTKLYIAWLWYKLRENTLFITVLFVNYALVISVTRSSADLAYVGVIGNIAIFQVWKWRHMKRIRSAIADSEKSQQKKIVDSNKAQPQKATPTGTNRSKFTAA